MKRFIQWQKDFSVRRLEWPALSVSRTWAINFGGFSVRLSGKYGGMNGHRYFQQVKLSESEAFVFLIQYFTAGKIVKNNTGIQC